jgi:hypothetical protein
VGFFRFLGRHLWAAVGGAIGLMFLAAGYADEGLKLWAIVQPWQLQALGATFFVIAIIMILYQWDQERLKTSIDSAVPIAAPLPSPPSNALAPPPKTKPVSAPVPAPISSTENRVILGPNLTPEVLMRLCVGKTQVQAQRAIQLYIGKWMKVKGLVEDVSASDNWTTVRIAPATGSSDGYADVALYFRDQREHVEVLQKGDHIVALGEIESISDSSVGLEKCELLTGD